MAGTVTLQFAGLASGYCFATFNQLGLDIITATSAMLAGSSNTFNYGNSTPAVTDQGKPWIRLNSDGTLDRIYTFSSGLWLSPHYQVQGQVIMYEGTEASISTFDGGEVAAVSATTGPFWEKVAEMNAKSPMGPGTLASGTIVSIGDNLGEEKHQLTIAELPGHTHQFASGDYPKSLKGTLTDKEGDINQTGSLDYKALQPLQNTGLDTAHNTIHPVHAIFFIRRTARTYYRI